MATIEGEMSCIVARFPEGLFTGVARACDL
jgi:hypothetical protein